MDLSMLTYLDAMETGGLRLSKGESLEKRDDITKARKDLPSTPMQQALYEGMSAAFSVLESCKYNARKVTLEARQWLLLQISNPSKPSAKIIAQGFIAGILFADTRIPRSDSMLLECLKAAYHYVSEAWKHLQQMHLEHSNKQSRAAVHA